MFRKFLMTSLLVNLVAVGEPEQVAAGNEVQGDQPSRAWSKDILTI
jgi:hypothetical protein